MDKLIAFARYLVSVRPDPNFEYTKLTLLVVGILLLVALAIRIWRKKMAKDEVLRRILKGYPTTLALFAMGLLVLLGFRELGFPIFSMRIWWVAFGLLFVIWMCKVLFGFRKEYRERKERFGHHLTKSKYLPKKKHR